MEITFKKFYIPAANLGKENVLPDVHDNAYIRATVSLTENIDKEDRKYIGKGMISTLLPYMNLDSYDRKRTVRGFDSVVLENEFLKATFVTELGGRLWSLYDKKKRKRTFILKRRVSTRKPCFKKRLVFGRGGMERGHKGA